MISDMSMDEHDVISAQDLQFGDYSSGTENGKEKASVNSQSNSTPARIPVLNASQDSEDDHFSDHDDKSNLLSPETAKSKQRFLSFEYYQSFFDVETHHVLTRMQASVILSWRNNFVKHYLRPNPDLYGPFWIAATLVFAIAINGNFSSLVKNYSGSGKNSTQKVTSQWAYDLDTISTAGLIMSLYLVCVPTLYWLFLRWRKSLNMFTLLEIVSLYGYSLTIFLPASLLWLIPVVAVQWSVSIVALLISSAALCLALWPSLQEEDMPVSFGTLTAVVLLQGLLVICFMVLL
ncbi:protein YIPF1-like isoform X1 [Convolutriloba macropyga]|uniref:protein YIPF1-like isoform X1 n=1 Tax=Convolutriloba macropyga TaxID=536237 RepID=UPI003F521B5B